MPSTPFRRTALLLLSALGSAAVPATIDSATGVLAIPAPLSAQTPEQRYTDWTRLEFRAQEYAYRRARTLDGLRASGGGLLLTPSSDGLTHGATFRQLEDVW